MNNKEYTDAIEKEQYPENPIVPFDVPFVDDRGSIQNLLNTNINGVAIIISKAGSIRSNHFHMHDFHYLYVLSGEMEYYERPMDEPKDPNKQPLLVKAGQMIFTPPKMVHKTVFLQNTVLLSFSKRNRDHKSHEADVMRAEF